MFKGAWSKAGRSHTVGLVVGLTHRVPHHPVSLMEAIVVAVVSSPLVPCVDYLGIR